MTRRDISHEQVVVLVVVVFSKETWNRWFSIGKTPGARIDDKTVTYMGTLEISHLRDLEKEHGEGTTLRVLIKRCSNNF
ncbi:hypothetical protein M0804_004121 [Polistes exclamans]|nr:hypothetical protein M0804_004121 [Polistes exclamans]